jgi:hypothetical protein
MTFKFQANEEQWYLVQDEEARRWRNLRPQHKKDEVARTKPKVKSFNRCHRPRSQRQSTRLREKRRLK